MKNEIKAKVETASNLGKQAFLNGKGRAPALSKEMMAMISEDSKLNIKLMTAFINGWDKANLSASY